MSGLVRILHRQHLGAIGPFIDQPQRSLFVAPEAIVLFCSSPSLSLQTEASSPADPWWPTLARVAVLRRFADQLSPRSPHLVEFRNNIVIGSVPIAAADPVMALLFRRASAAATSLGLIASRDPNPGDSGSADTQVWSCIVVDRAGPAATGFWRHDNTLRAAGEASGVVVDLMLRILDRPTPACAASTEVFWSADWLARMALASQLGTEPLSLADVQAHSPPGASSALMEASDVDESSRAVLTRCWADALITQLNDYSWSDLRLAIAEGELSSPLMPPRAAAWFDAGSFGRWCMSNELFAGGLEPHLAEILTALAFEVVSDTLIRVRAANVVVGNDSPTPLEPGELLP